MNTTIHDIFKRASQSLRDEHHDTEAGWNAVQQKCQLTKKHSSAFLFLKYVAIAVILISAGTYTWHISSENKQPDHVFNFTYPTTQPELILANGKRIQLENGRHAITTEELGAYITQGNDNGILQYQADSVQKDAADSFNQLIVPKGGEYKVKLPDGSVVHINSESSLKFSVHFPKDGRDVYLAGEAFFEIKANEKAPFNVHTGSRKVTVLGTRFNINAYPDDHLWQTTLVQGKVSVEAEGQTILLEPSQQCTIDNTTGELALNTVNTQEYTSWMEGKFYFKQYKFKDVIKSLERWYDFEINYEQEDIKDMCFRGVINKDCRLEETLRNLEETTNIVFDIQGKTITARKVNK